MSDTTETLNKIDGTVKWFDPRKGYGFITGPQEQDIFVHYTVIQGDGFRALSDGASVIYDAENSDKGWRATSVVLRGADQAADNTDGTNVDASEDSDEAEVVVSRPKTTYSRTPRR